MTVKERTEPASRRDARPSAASLFSDGRFTSLRAGRPMMLAVNIDFNQASGDSFEIEVKGDADGFRLKMPGPARGRIPGTVQYRFQVG